VPDTDQQAKSLPTLIGELWQLVVEYFKQETVGRLRGLLRYIGFGVAGSLLLSVGLLLLIVAGLRALQTETGTTFSGDWTWAPYGICLGGAVLVIGLAVTMATRTKGRSR